MDTDHAKRRMQEALAGLPDGHFEPFAQAMADDLVWTVTGQTPFSRSYRGKKVVFDELLHRLAGRIDGPYRYVPERFIADGDMCVVEGRGNNLLRDGRRYDNTYCWVCRIEDGKIRELTEYLDTDLVMRLFSSR
jgi:ketosteroid isomerase-like protein